MKKPGWKVHVEGGGHACAPVCLHGWSGEVCAEGGDACVEGVCEGFFALSHTCVSSSSSFIWKCLYLAPPFPSQHSSFIFK